MDIKTKIANKIIIKNCACCGRAINVVVYADRKYRGGHYFGKVYDMEYWECPGCYWGKIK